jgi:hypothetical protein
MRTETQSRIYLTKECSLQRQKRCQEKAVRMDGDSHVIGGVDVSGSKLLQKEGGT